MPAMNKAQFPVYLVEKISEDVDMVDSYEAMRSYVEPIDVEEQRIRSV